jgi:uncharacterized protein (DUF58 family)
VTFLVSDFMAENYETALRVANRRHDVIAAVVMDPREETLPNVGLMAVQDAETGREVRVHTGNPRTRKRYALAAQERRRALEDIFRRNRVDMISVRTDRPYIDEVYRFFRMREKRVG